MKSFIKSERFIYILITAAFLGAFLTVYLMTEIRLGTIHDAVPVVIHDVTTENESKGKTVYLTASGKKYHLDGCDYLREKRIAVAEADAINAGYEACKYCQP